MRYWRTRSKQFSLGRARSLDFSGLVFLSDIVINNPREDAVYKKRDEKIMIRMITSPACECARESGQADRFCQQFLVVTNHVTLVIFQR